MRAVSMLAAWLLICGLALADDDADRRVFFDAQRTITETLTHRSIGEWADEVAARPPATAGEAVLKIVLLKRAGRLDGTRDAIDQAAALRPAVPTQTMNEVAEWLVRRERAPERSLARHVYEQFPQCFTGVAYASYNHWKDDEGATDQQIENWIADRAHANPQWRETYHQYLADHRRLDVALDPARKLCEDEPTIDHVIDYLKIAQIGRVDPAPVLALAKPRLHEEMLDLAHYTEDPMAQARLLEQALATPRTPEDAKYAPRRPIYQQQRALTEPFERHAERRLRQQLVRDYTAANRPDLAKPHLEALAKLPGEESTAFLPPTAKDNEAIIARQMADEAARKNEPEYWLQRAEMELLRKDAKAAEAAFNRAFDVAEVDEARRGKDGRMFKSNMLRDWIRLVPMPADGYDFAWAKLEGQPKSSLMVRNTMLGFAGFMDEDKPRRSHLTADDERLWAILTETAKWEYSEEMILRSMMENADYAQQQKLIDRALKLTEDQDLSRTKIATFCVIAFAKEPDNQRPFFRKSTPPAAAELAGYDRLLPRLERLYRESPDRSDRASAAGRLSEIYLRLGRWKEAEGLLPKMTDYDLREVLSARSNVAECAARAGAKDDAMRLWKEIANQDRLQFNSLRALARAGLDAPLREFYAELARKEPRSVAAEQATRELDR